MKKSPSIIKEILSSYEPPILGIVLNRDYMDEHDSIQEIVSHPDNSRFCKLLNVPSAYDEVHLIVVIRTDGKVILSHVCDDKNSLPAAFQMINARMDEIGLHTNTGWLFMPDTCRGLLLNGAAQHAKDKWWLG